MEKQKPKAKAKRDPFQLGEYTIQPGERLTFELPLPPMITTHHMGLPMHVIHGKKEGPVLFVSGAIHGDEINGTEIIARLLKVKLLSHLKGTLIAVPMVNIYGFLNTSRYLPDRRDLNRSFPGFETGSMASRLAHTFYQDIVKKSTHGIDLHTAAIHRSNLPQLRVDYKQETARAMAEAFGAPVILHSPVLEGSLREAGQKSDVPIIVYECGEALRFDEMSIRAGIKGIISVMRYLNMLPEKKRIEAPKVSPMIARSSSWMRAPVSGILRSKVGLGSWVNKGEQIGVVGDPLGENEIPVMAKRTGLVIGRTELPLVDEGNAIFHIATLEEDTEVEPVIAHFRNMGASDEWSLANL